MEEKVLKLRVKPIIELPHILSKAGGKYVFAPDALIPDRIGQSLLTAFPDRYEIAKGEPDLSKYVYKKSFRTQTMHDLVESLNDDEQVKVAAYIEKLLDDREAIKVKAAKAEEDQLKKDLKEKAEEEQKKKIAAEAQQKKEQEKKADKQQAETTKKP